MNDIVSEFAEQAGLDAATVEERWNGRPDRMAEDLFKIKDLDTGKIGDLNLFSPYQPKIIHAYFYGDATTLNVYKGRRIGVSFIICLCLALDGMMNPNSFFPIVSSKEEQAQSRIRDIKNLLENANVKIPLNKSIAGEIELWNGARFKAYTGNPAGARGDDSAKTVFIDEMAFLEDQDATSRSFSPFVSLGSQGLMVEVSTPEAKNDLFMRNHARGTETGYDDEGNRIGTISIKQPSFKNADEIDVEVPLHEQNVEPVRPDLNVNKVEEDRLKDPQGFAQEYLCRPIDESYRFFSETSVERAMERSRAADYQYGLYSRKTPGIMRTMGVDIGIDHDETVVSVFDHVGEERKMRYWEVIDNDALVRSGMSNPDRGNAVHVANHISQLQEQLNADYIILDSTGPGATFDKILRERLGRIIIGFNFSDRDAVKKMFGDMNAALRNGKVVLDDNARMFDQLVSIVREQKRDGQKPKFTGKDYSESGKDDIAMSVVLGAFPPKVNELPVSEVQEKPYEQPPTKERKPPEPKHARTPADDGRKQTTGVFVKGSVSRSSRGSYQSRYSRNRY